MIKNNLFLAVSLLLSFGCAKVTDHTPAATEDTRKLNCYPESELMVSGIVGGSVVAKAAPDSKNVVMIVSGKEGHKELCTATALTKDVLLTAAHCVADSIPEETFMLTSSTQSCESGFDSTRDQISVRKIVVHEGYTPADDSSAEYITNDLALVFLKKSLPASYPTYKIAESDAVSTDGYLYFWGFGEVANGRGGAGLLRKTQTSSNDYEIDQGLKRITVNQSTGHGICHGDSGGPGFVKQNGELKILGVNSFVSGTDIASECSGQSTLTLASSYKAWLENELAKLGEKLK